MKLHEFNFEIALSPSGSEKDIRCGFYGKEAGEVRSAACAHTHSDEWWRTDPQQPKSIWWYSDFKGIGFRVVCEVDSSIVP